MMATRCTLCCHHVQSVKNHESTLDSGLFISLCKALKTCGPSSFQASLTKTPICSSCLDLLKTADDTLIKLEELELKIAKIAEDLKCTLKRGYSTLKESWELPGHEFEYVPTDVQKFLLKAVGVDTDEDYIEVVPLSHDEFDHYEEGYDEDDFLPVDTGAFNEDGDDDLEVVEVDNSEAIQCDETQASEKSSEGLSSCGRNNKRKSPIKDLPSRNSKTKCDSDSIEGSERLGESMIEADTSKVRSKRRVGDGLTNSEERKRKRALWYCLYSGCRKGFESIKTVRAHMLQPHDVEIVNTNLEFKCKKCEQCFPKYVDMFNHLASEHAAEANPRSVSLFCQKCGQDFTSVKALKVHMRDHSSKGQKCSEYYCFYDGCHEMCENTTTLRAHLLKPHKVEIVNQDVEFSCDKCNECFPTYVAMFSHLSSVHGATINPRLMRLLCQNCGHTYSTMRELEAHMKDHRRVVFGSLSCGTCGKSFVKACFIRRHERVCGNTRGKGLWSCRICRKTFLSRCLHMKHTMGFNQCTLTKKKACRVFACRGCGESFLKRKEHRKHSQRCKKCPRIRLCNYSGCTKSFMGDLMIDLHLREPHEVDRPDNGTNPYFACDMCKILFASYKLTWEHIRTVHPADVMKTRQLCQICGRFYKTVSFLRKHLKYHAGEMLICETCGKTFAKKSELDKHIRGSHCPLNLNERSDILMCKGCSKVFKFETWLRKHQKKGCPSERKEVGDIRCKFCAKEFPNQVTLKAHENRHKRPRMTCDVCQRKFRCRSELVRHRRAHFPEEKLACHLCPAKFGRSWRLKNHINMKHLGKPRMKCPECNYICLEKNDMETHMRKHTGEKPFMCDICGMTFRSQPHMKNHRKYHIGKPHKCEHCGHEFMHRYRYERHMRTHTNPQLHWKVRQKLAREAAKKAQSDDNV